MRMGKRLPSTHKRRGLKRIRRQQNAVQTHTHTHAHMPFHYYYLLPTIPAISSKPRRGRARQKQLI